MRGVGDTPGTKLPGTAGHPTPHYWSPGPAALSTRQGLGNQKLHHPVGSEAITCSNFQPSDMVETICVSSSS